MLKPARAIFSGSPALEFYWGAKMLEERIAGRKDAEELLAMVGGGTEDYLKGVATALRAFANRVLGEEKSESELRVMTEIEAKAFEEKRIKYGRNAGETYGEAPIDDLVWLVDSTLPLAAYLRSDRGKRRIENNSDD